MILTTLALTLGMMSASMPSASDTTFAVRAPGRLAIENFAGAITVRGWNRNEVRVRADHSSRSYLVIRRNGPNVVVAVEHRQGIPTTVEYDVSVPTWMSLELNGVSTEISVEGTQSEIKAETVAGDVEIVGGQGFIIAGSVSGDVSVTGSRGKVTANGVSGQVRVTRTSGPVEVSAVNGDVALEDIDSNDVEASTVNGAVAYAGSIRDDGSYHFGSHGGDVTVTVPGRVNASVSISTFQGDFSSDFPVSFSGTHGHKHEFSFTLGSGSARIELETFQGQMRLLKAGSNPSRDRLDKERGKGKDDKNWKGKKKSGDSNESEDDQP